jgi:glutaconate CoA-transferase subunit A
MVALLYLALGVPFLPSSALMGTDTFKYSGAREVACPFTGQKLIAVPALFSDVGFLHVHCADVYGNAQVDGITIADWDMVRVSKRLTVTTERIVSTDEIRQAPSRINPFLPLYIIQHHPWE